MLEVLAEVFLNDEAPACIGGMGEALAGADLSSFAAYAHRLKGSALVFGAQPLADECLAAERCASPVDGERLLTAIETELANVEAALRGAA